METNEALQAIADAKLNNQFNVQVLRWLFDDKDADYLRAFEESLSLDETINFAFDCDSVGYVYVGTAGAVIEDTGAVIEDTGAVIEDTGAVIEGAGADAVIEGAGAVIEGAGAV
jgi:hypothetical protein